jgi:aminoglycoside 6-adenylyltransferase
MDTLEQRITIWADTRPEIRLTLAAGSHASTVPAAGEWADLALYLFCTGCDALVADPGWLESIGEVWNWLPTRIDGDMPRLQVLFDRGRRIDFTFVPLSLLAEPSDERVLDEIHSRGYTILLDKDGWATGMPTPPARSPEPSMPAGDTFRRVVDDFLHGAVHVAKQICRRNLWVVKLWDWKTKELLLQMMEWHARAVNGREYETYRGGHLMASWTDAQTWEEVQTVFGGFGAAQAWHALFETMKSFRRLARRTALSLGYEYPAVLDRRITMFAQELYDGDRCHHPSGTRRESPRPER